MTQELIAVPCSYITMLVSKISSVLGNEAAASKYEADATRIAAAVNKVRPAFSLFRTRIITCYP